MPQFEAVRKLLALRPGDILTAETLNVLGDAIDPEIVGTTTDVTPHGVYIESTPPSPNDWEFGRLDEALDGDAPNTSATFKVYRESSGTWSDSGNTKEVYPSYHDSLWHEKFGPGHPGWIQYHKNGRWYFFARYQTVRFELAEALEQWQRCEDSNDPVTACVKKWDPGDNCGKGDFAIADACICVSDRRRVGYFGDAGAEGAAEIRYGNKDESGNYQEIGVIVDLECPTGCLCGTVDPYAYDYCGYYGYCDSYDCTYAYGS